MLERVIEALDRGRIWVVNVAGHDQRLAWVTRELEAAGLTDFERFDAWTPDRAREHYAVAPHLIYDFDARRPSLDNRLLNGWNALACGASHMELWRSVVDNPEMDDDDAFLVFEDDAAYRPPTQRGQTLPSLRQVLAGVRELEERKARSGLSPTNRSPELGLLLLGYFRNPLFGAAPRFDKRGEPRDQRTQLYTLESHFLGSHAYAATKRVARSMLEMLGGRLDCHIDYTMGTLSRCSQVEARRVPAKAKDAFSIAFIAPRLFPQNCELEDAEVHLATTIHKGLPGHVGHRRSKGRETLPWHVRYSLKKMLERPDVAKELERRLLRTRVRKARHRLRHLLVTVQRAWK